MTQNLAWPVLANSFQGSLFPLSLGAKLKTLETRSLMQRTVLYAYCFCVDVFQFVKGQLHVISLQRVLALNIDIIL